MILNVDEEKLTIQGVSFDNSKEFKIVRNAISSSMIEGWQPSTEKIERLRDKAIAMRGVQHLVQKNI